MFNETEMTDEQVATIGTLVTTLGKPKCDSQEEVTTKACAEGQDQCQKVAVTSMLGGDTELPGFLLQCGIEEGMESVCTTYTTLAAAFFPLESCSTTGCLTDNCNGAETTTRSLYVLVISAFFYLFVRV